MKSITPELQSELKVIEHAIISAEHVNLSLGYSDAERYKTVALTHLHDATIINDIASVLPRDVSKLIPVAHDKITENRALDGANVLYKILKHYGINKKI